MPLPHSIDAPYNFVPLADWVYLPKPDDWAGRVSHDLPFRDGLCGHLDLTITAHTPILVGREHRRGEEPSAEHPGQVHPYQLPDGRYALPGTALKGMLRNVVEIATFSRMSAVDDQRLGVRDLTGGVQAYQKAMTTTIDHAYKPLAKAGWLAFDPHLGAWTIHPCRQARVEHHLLTTYLGRPWVKITRSDRPTAAEKYTAWTHPRGLEVEFDAGPEAAHKHSQDRRGNDKYLWYSKATNLGRGAQTGILVFTGQPSPQKHMEFIFFGSTGAPVPVPERVFCGFLDIHDQHTENGPRTPWTTWREHPRVPIFYLEEQGQPGTIASLGLAQMYKLPYRHSIHEAIGHSCAEHTKDGAPDLATLLFGRVGADPASCLKGRVRLHHAVAVDPRPPQPQNLTILNGPKATYYPNYIQQTRAQNCRLPERSGYSTLMDPDCRIRGWKRYPARPPEQAEVQPLTDQQRDNPAVQTRLHPLPAETRFTGRLDFHNLLPVELGALCWALTWGGSSELRHGLGMGKPFGFGQVSISISGVELRPNRPGASAPSWQECSNLFVGHMDEAHRQFRPGKRRWRDSDEVRTLLAMADPRLRPAGQSRLQHMSLATEDHNDFKDAKLARLVLCDYPKANPPAPAHTGTGSASAPGDPPLEWAGVTLTLNPSSGELSVTRQGVVARVGNPQAQALRATLSQAHQERLKGKRELKGCTATVEKTGNAWRLIAIRAADS